MLMSKKFLKKKKTGQPKFEHKNFTFRLCAQIVDTKEGVIIYENGDKIRFITESLYPLNAIDGTPLFNAYGQQVYNDFYKEKGIS